VTGVPQTHLLPQTVHAVRVHAHRPACARDHLQPDDRQRAGGPRLVPAPGRAHQLQRHRRLLLWLLLWQDQAHRVVAKEDLGGLHR